jgi:dTMP kinase
MTNQVHHSPGQFITLEGIEGAGKTTQCQTVYQAIQEAGFPCKLTREPGGCLIAERIRELLLDRSLTTFDPKAELLLIFAARVQHLNEVILPALEAGYWVICDRFTDTSYAYQGGGRGLDPAWIAQLETFTQAGRQPDLTLWLDVPVAIGLTRAQQRRQMTDRFEAEAVAFFTRARQVYIDRSVQYPNRIIRIAAEGSLSEITQLVYTTMHTYLYKQQVS